MSVSNMEPTIRACGLCSSVVDESVAVMNEMSVFLTQFLGMSESDSTDENPYMLPTKVCVACYQSACEAKRFKDHCVAAITKLRKQFRHIPKSWILGWPEAEDTSTVQPDTIEPEPTDIKDGNQRRTERGRTNKKIVNDESKSNTCADGKGKSKQELVIAILWRDRLAAERCMREKGIPRNAVPMGSPTTRRRSNFVTNAPTLANGVKDKLPQVIQNSSQKVVIQNSFRR